MIAMVTNGFMTVDVSSLFVDPPIESRALRPIRFTLRPVRKSPPPVDLMDPRVTGELDVGSL